MMMELSIDQTRAMLVAMCDAIIDNVDLLTKADQAIGDGDHGVGMRRGFKAAKEAVEAAEPGSVGDLFKAGGSAIIATRLPLAMADATKLHGKYAKPYPASAAANTW